LNFYIIISIKKIKKKNIFLSINIKNNEESKDTIKTQTSNSSLLPPSSSPFTSMTPSLAPVTLSKGKPNSATISFNHKPPLPSNLSKSKTQITNLKPSSFPSSSSSSPSSNLQSDNISITVTNSLNDNTVSSLINNSTSTSTSSSTTSLFSPKKQFNGTTATIHYLELKLNEKDKEISVLKDSYEKTIRDLRSNLSKVKMESAIQIFELKNEIKGKNDKEF